MTYLHYKSSESLKKLRSLWSVGGPQNLTEFILMLKEHCFLIPLKIHGKLWGFGKKNYHTTHSQEFLLGSAVSYFRRCFLFSAYCRQQLQGPRPQPNGYSSQLVSGHCNEIWKILLQFHGLLWSGSKHNRKIKWD